MPTAAKPVHVGCSGWSYKDWRGVLYPEGVPATRCYAVENATTLRDALGS